MYEMLIRLKHMYLTTGPRLDPSLRGGMILRKILVIASVLSLSCAAIAFSQDLPGLAMPDLCSLAENVKVNPYVQAGFQHVGSNINLPISAEVLTAGLLQIDEMDIELEDANFWTGVAGVTLKKG